MSKRQFIKENKETIDNHIKSALGVEFGEKAEGIRLNNHERELWIANDESLYRMARRAGVKI